MGGFVSCPQVAGWWFWTELLKCQPSPCHCQSSPGSRSEPINSHVYKVCSLCFTSSAASLPVSCSVTALRMLPPRCLQCTAVGSSGGGWCLHRGACSQPCTEGFTALSSLQSLNSTFKPTMVTTMVSCPGRGPAVTAGLEQAARSCWAWALSHWGPTGPESG